MLNPLPTYQYEFSLTDNEDVEYISEVWLRALTNTTEVMLPLEAVYFFAEAVKHTNITSAHQVFELMCGPGSKFCYETVYNGTYRLNLNYNNPTNDIDYYVDNVLIG